MKKLYYILLLPLLALLGACSNDVIDDLSGTFDNIERDNFTTVTTEPTDKLKKGLKYLNFVFKNETDTELHLRVVSREWTLQPGTYTPMASVNDEPKAMQFYGFISHGSVAEGAFTQGNLEVSVINGQYIISGLLTGGDNKQYVVNFRGGIDFIIGEDDPEPSGYMVSIATSQVGYFDYSSFQFIVVPGVSKYTLSITSPEGTEAAMFELINNENLSKEQLAGTYTIAENAMSAGLMCNGYYLPEYSAIGGSYYVASDGSKQYLGKGSVELAYVDGMSGEKLLNIKGNGLEWVGSTGTGSVNINIPFAIVLEKTGTEVKDQVFHSETLGRDVQYSVLLPKSFDGSKEYPVLYLLHGAGGNNNDWLDSGHIASYTGTVDTEMVIIMPQGSFDGTDCFYIDDYQGKGFNYETFFITEFMPAMETMYKGNGKRGLSGLSMGGYGTLYYGLKYVDKFAGMYACSPALAMDGIPSIFDMIWAPGAAPFTVEIGTEDFLYEGCKGLNEAMQFSPLLPGFTYIERGGVHDWAFWSACSPKIIAFFNEMFSK